MLRMSTKFNGPVKEKKMILNFPTKKLYTLEAEQKIMELVWNVDQVDSPKFEITRETHKMNKTVE